MAENTKHVYDESKIKTLSSLEHIRLRTGMYIGRIGDGSHYDDGCYILLKEVEPIIKILIYFAIMISLLSLMRWQIKRAVPIAP